MHSTHTTRRLTDSTSQRAIDIGSEIGPQHCPGTPVEQVTAYVGNSLVREPLFIDVAYARSLGFRGIVVPGPMVTAFLEQLLRRELVGWHLDRLSTTFRMPTITGDPIILSGVITELHEMADGERIICDLVVEHESGEQAVTGVATLRRV